MTLTVLKQFLPPSPIAISPATGQQAEGVMVTLQSPSLRSKDAVSVRLDAVLEDGRYTTLVRAIVIDPKYPNTIWFPIGKTAYVLQIQVNVQTAHKFSAIETEEDEPQL